MAASEEEKDAAFYQLGVEVCNFTNLVRRHIRSKIQQYTFPHAIFVALQSEAILMEDYCRSELGMNEDEIKLFRNTAQSLAEGQLREKESENSYGVRHKIRT
ncbi:MAG: hypothetical protein PXY39_02935 [archaeon]|nr:hypothetical protein [archaeon]